MAADSSAALKNLETTQMNAFLWTMIAVFALNIMGKARMLHTQDFARNPELMPFDMGIEVGLLAWAVYLLK
jgi:hypothetical protein